MMNLKLLPADALPCPLCRRPFLGGNLRQSSRRFHEDGTPITASRCVLLMFMTEGVLQSSAKVGL